VAPRGGATASPFVSAVWRHRQIGEAAGEDAPVELFYAQLYDALLRIYPGYTLTTLKAEDAHELLTMRALLHPDLGKATDE
jgi:hypothetical protein